MSGFPVGLATLTNAESGGSTRPAPCWDGGGQNPLMKLMKLMKLLNWANVGLCFVQSVFNNPGVTEC